MKSNHSIIHYSVLAALLAVVPGVATSAVRIGNHSRGYSSYNNQNNPTVRSQINNPGNAVMGTVAPAPTPTVNATENDSAAATNESDEHLSATASHECPLIYPNAEIAWGTPTIGAGIGGADTCVATVELVGYQAAEDGSDLVLARANLALGDTFKCNISSFPEATMYIDAVESFYFPTDNPPTIDDVIAQMNQEQKQNAGLKIAAGALIGGLGGNMAGTGDGDSLLGTNKEKVQSTVIGALSGAALMAGNTYAGKVAGDVILSTGVNAAAGGVVGNMAQTGDSVLRIEDCTITENGVDRKTTCLWGSVATTDAGLQPGERAYYRIDDGSGTTYVCSDTTDASGNTSTRCNQERLVNIRLAAYPNTDITQIKEEQFEKIYNTTLGLQYYMTTDLNGNVDFTQSGANSDNGIWAEISSANRIKNEIPAMIELQDKAFGFSSEDWDEWKRNNGAGVKIYGRSTTGNAYELSGENVASIQNFYPMKIDADDGAVIDFGNKARLKSTLIGAGVGGALGGFTAYQGAQLDVQNRWTTAMREYEDSLSKVYCRSGSRWLSRYNDTVFVPASLNTAE